jgi:glycosyltransferase involved in cell wall biosynthesis
MDQFESYYSSATAFASSKRAHLVLLNFESPNWFNRLSPVQRDIKLWENWERVSRYCSLILSISEEGQKYALEYYTRVPPTARFNFSYPSINTFVADKILAKKIKKQKRIIIFSRFYLAAHKGCYNIPDIMCPAMRGYTFVIIIGTGAIPDDIYGEILEKAAQWGVKIETKSKLSDYEKFMEIRKAALLLFPSFFEGYGYPPVEALYVNTPCIAFELPVLRETCRDNLIYVPRGDWSAFKEKIADVLMVKEPKTIPTHEKIRKVAKFEEYAQKMDHIVTNIASRELPGELLKFKGTRRIKPRRQPRQTGTRVDGLLKPVSRLMKKHLAHHTFEGLKIIYKNYKTKKKSALKTTVAIISLFAGKRKKYPGNE